MADLTPDQLAAFEAFYSAADDLGCSYASARQVWQAAMAEQLTQAERQQTVMRLACDALKSYSSWAATMETEMAAANAITALNQTLGER